MMASGFLVLILGFIVSADAVSVPDGYLAGSAEAVNAISTRRVITCADSDTVQHLSCETGVISVQSVLFGRQDRVTCSESRPSQQLTNTKCSLSGSKEIIKARCDGRKLCEVNPTVFPSDPCVGIFKYLDTTYSCFPAVRTVACDSSVAELQCGEGSVISVIGAYFGRTDQTTCSFQRPPAQLQKTDCVKPVGEVALSCNGKTSCSVKAGGFLFEDPCVGTYKYLEVAHTCKKLALGPYV